MNPLYNGSADERANADFVYLRFRTDIDAQLELAHDALHRAADGLDQTPPDYSVCQLRYAARKIERAIHLVGLADLVQAHDGEQNEPLPQLS